MHDNNTPSSSKLWNDPALVTLGLALLKQPMTHADVALANQFAARIGVLGADRRTERPKVWQDREFIAGCSTILAHDYEIDLGVDVRCLEYQGITGSSIGSCDIRHPEWNGDLSAAGAATLIIGNDVLLLHLATIDRLDALLAFKQIVIVDEVAYALAERYAEMQPFSDPWRLHRWIDQQVRACRVLCPATWFGQKMTQVREEAGDDEIELVIALDAIRKLVNREAFWRLAVIEHMARPESVASIQGPVVLVVEDPRTAHHYDLIDLSRDDRCKTEHIDRHTLLQVLGIKDDFIRSFIDRVGNEECIG